jgi:hypothetical protein
MDALMATVKAKHPNPRPDKVGGRRVDRPVPLGVRAASKH